MYLRPTHGGVPLFYVDNGKLARAMLQKAAERLNET
jgi:hypothetical protein